MIVYFRSLQFTVTKKDMLRNFIAFILLALSQIGFTQDQWKSGYVLPIEGDTIYGQIQVRDSKSNSNKCVFQLSANEKSTTYSPTQIQGYRIDGGKFFVSKSVAKVNDGEPLFFEFLINGRVKIYHIKADESRYFVEKENEIYELLNSELEVNHEGARYVRESKEYVGTLSYLFSDATDKLDVSTSRLDPKSLIAVSKKYHENVCPNEVCTIYEMPDVKPQVSYSFFSGVFFSSLNFGTDIISDTRWNGLIGAKMVVDKPFYWAENVSLHVDFALSRYSEYGLIRGTRTRYVQYESKPHTMRENPLNVNFKALSLKAPISVNYYLFHKRLKPYLGMGVVNLIFIKQNSDFEYSHFIGEYGRSIPFYHLGLLAKTGMKYPLENGKNIFIEASYEVSENLNPNQYLRLKTRSLSFILGYNF